MLRKIKVPSQCLLSLHTKTLSTKITVEEEYLSDPSLSNEQQLGLKSMLNLYRSWGYRHAKTNPLQTISATSPLHEALADNVRISKMEKFKVHLDNVYCGSLGFQFMYIPDLEKQQFLASLIENPVSIDEEQSISLAKTMLRGAGLDKFLANKFSNMKQYSGEGAEGILAFCQSLFQLCPKNQIEDIVIGIAHRGRISLMTELLDLPYDRLLHKYSGNYEFHNSETGIGDVLSHLWQSVDLRQSDGSNLHITLLPNPSHLEVVNSVVLGKVRAKMRARCSSPYGENHSKPLALLIHGDAAFVGQGCSYENAQMSKLEGFETSGSIHLITNNLIGFTSENSNACSTFTVGDIGYED